MQAREMKKKALMSTESNLGPLVIPEMEPLDEYNRELVANVHPPDWVNPEPARSYNLVVIGAGTAGLVSAAGAAGLGAKVALIERHHLGGDCLNYGCVPSKAILRSARAAAAFFGPGFDMGLRRQRISMWISVQLWRGCGASGSASAAMIQPGASRIWELTSFWVRQASCPPTVCKWTAKCCSSNGLSSPPEPGPYSQRSWGWPKPASSPTKLSLPSPNYRRASVMGAGPIGCEFAQAFQWLGARVTLLHKYDRIMNKEDADAAAIIQEVFQREGITLIFNYLPLQVRKTDTGKIIEYDSNGRSGSLEVDEIIIGAGRTPNVEGLNLEAAEVGDQPGKGRGVPVNELTSRPATTESTPPGDICKPVPVYPYG